MAKLVLSDLVAFVNSGITLANSNWAAIEAAIENTLSRDGTAPNAMGANLDMNSFRMINVGNGLQATDAVNLQQLSDSDATGAASAQLRLDLLASTGASLIGAIQSGVGAVATDVQTRGRLVVYVQDFDADGDGTTDDSTKIQAAIDAHKGKTILFPAGYQYYAAGILLSGSTYDGTELLFEGEFKLKADGGSSNFGGAWVGIILKDCDRVKIKLKANGNRSAMTDREGVHVVGIAGATNCEVVGKIREVRGDGVYISQSTWTSNTANPRGIKIDVEVVNSADDGRNAVSLVAGDDIRIKAYSYKVGGTINGSLMPGGVDIEPNFGYQTVSNVVVDADVTTAGTSGISIAGKAITNDATRDWCVSDVTLRGRTRRTGTTGSGLAQANIMRCKDIRVDLDTSYATTKGSGFGIDYADRIRGRLTASNVTMGVKCGTAEELRDFDLDVFVSNYDTCGLRTTNVTRGKFKGRVYGAVAGTNFAVQCHDEARGGITQTNVIYSVDAPYDAVVDRAFRNEPTRTVSYSGTYVTDCDWTGYANFSTQCDAEIPSYNVKGRNYNTVQPNAGAWHQGDFVQRSNNSALDANNMFLLGWMRITTGTGNVAGTDWLNARVSDVSPAT